MVKTNVMRLLDKAKLAYTTREYAYSEDDLSGVHAAAEMGLPCSEVFKTLVLKGDKKGYFVCVIPVDKEVDLKKAAKISGNKSAEMIHVKELLPLTGYIRGGCSPIGMKKRFPTYIDASAEALSIFHFSAGQRGVQISMDPQKLKEYIGAEYAELTV